jgi:hypothetical protein
VKVKTIKAILNVLAALCAFAAAVLWYKASTAIVRPTETVDRDGWLSEQITVEHEQTGPFDPFLTGIEQSKWNKWGALAASVAAAIQGIVLMLPE